MQCASGLGGDHFVAAGCGPPAPPPNAQGPTLSRAVSVADAARARADDVIMCAFDTMLCHFAHLRARAFHTKHICRRAITAVKGSQYSIDGSASVQCTVSYVRMVNAPQGG